ncbi:hypothetical protein CPB86DRAFT_810361 [Serendipita vermifera]|nr:hypothetical protein CPB86DRAFT_810361 [Serendipita vermifera]
MTSQNRELNLTYELPKVVDKLLSGWAQTYSSGTVASTLLASVAAAIFIHIQEQIRFADEPEGSNPPNRLQAAANSPKGNALLIFAYLGIIANCSATITSFLIADKLTEVHFTGAQKDYKDEETKQDKESEQDSSTIYTGGLHKLFREDTQFLFGVLCIFAELMLYLWIVETNFTVKLVISVFSVFGLTPAAIFVIDIGLRMLDMIAYQN